MNLLEGLEKLINEHGSAVILKERIALANDKHAALERTLSELELRASKLEAENEALRLDKKQLEYDNQRLEAKLSTLSSSPEFIDEAGALFKKNSDGTYNQTPYCPSCKTAMVSPGRQELYRCGRKSCGQFASFKGIALGDVMSRLP